MVFVWRAKLLYCDFDKLLMRKACGSCILWMGSIICLFGALSEKNVQLSYTFDSSRINMLKAISTAGNHSGKAELTGSGKVVITAEGHKK